MLLELDGGKIRRQSRRPLELESFKEFLLTSFCCACSPGAAVEAGRMFPTVPRVRSMRCNTRLDGYNNAKVNEMGKKRLTVDQIGAGRTTLQMLL